MARPMAEGRFTQGRIRVNKHGAPEVLDALERHVEFLIDCRSAVWDIPETRTLLNARIEHTRRVLDELMRTGTERGWSLGDQDGEPE